MTDVAQRYRRQRRARRPLLVAAVGLLAAAGIAWLLWVMNFHGRPLVESNLVSFTVTDEHAGRATMAIVRRDRDVQASCLLRAQASDHSIVGEATFEVGPAEPATATLTRTIRTEREATAIFVVGCVADGQPQPR